MAEANKNKIFNIPNLLSLFRICLIPLFVVAYEKGHNYIACGILLLSGLTDILDGRIARKYNMITEFGKALDPIADKCTQIVVAFCLIRRFPHMIILFLFLLLKETVTGIVGLVVIKKTKRVNAAVWHGKLTTVLLYIVMSVHILWSDIPPNISDLSIGLCLGIMLISFILYLIMHYTSIKEAGKKGESGPEE